MTAAAPRAGHAERDLQIARQIQAGFLPEELPQPPGWELAARCEPAREVGGDFYDAFYLTNRRRVGFVIADVCDKGVGAALFMAIFRTLVRAFAQQHYALSWADALAPESPAGAARGGRRTGPAIGSGALKNAVTLTNAYIVNTHGASGMFATLFFGILDPATGALAYINAGHNPPLLAGGGGLKATLAGTGPALGILADAEWEIREAELARGDLLLCYTDGVTEARSRSGDLYSDARLQALARGLTSGAAGALAEVDADLRRHTAGAEQSDDITLLLVRRA